MNKINLEECDLYELSYITNEMLSCVVGYFHHMALNEQKKIYCNQQLINEYTLERSRIISILIDSNEGSSRDNLEKNINLFLFTL